MTKSEPAAFRHSVSGLCQEFAAGLPLLIARAQEQGATIHCRDHCSNCCSLAVFTTLPEALRIAGKLTPAQVISLEQYIAQLQTALHPEVNLRSFLKLHRQLRLFCPFLEHASCSIYPWRPLACRALLSTRPAAWCAVDFSTLHTLEQQAFLSSLDRQVVDFPSHYLASSRQQGQTLETLLLEQMQRQCGFALSGHLPTLVWLETKLQLSHNLRRGPDWLRENLSRAGLSSPCLLQFHDQQQGADDVL
jgi:Fe-S-cluster containining protein